MPLPVDYQTCLVTGEWVNIATGEPGVGYVKFTPRATRITTQSEVIVLPTVRRVWLVGGVISEEIPATDDPQVQPLEWTYQVTEVINGVTYPTYDIEAPVGGTVDLSSVAGVGSAGTIVGIPGPPGPGAVLSNDPAQALGTASAGVGAEGSRDDHVHPMPDASDVGADPAGTAAAAVAAIPDDGPDATPSLRTLGWFAGQAAGGAAVSTSLLTMSNNIADHHAETTTAHGGIVASTDPRLTDARTPTAHEASHHHDGSDPLSAADVGADPAGTAAALVAALPSFTAGRGIDITEVTPGVMEVGFDNIQVDVYTPGTTSLTVPSWARMAYVTCIGGGGGGGGGRRGATSTVRGGGGGGQGGAVVSGWVRAANIATTISVGAGGTSGAGGASDSTSGANGGNGGDTAVYYGTGLALLRAAGGEGGRGGTNTDGGQGGGLSPWALNYYWPPAAGNGMPGSDGGGATAVLTMLSGRFAAQTADPSATTAWITLDTMWRILSAGVGGGGGGGGYTAANANSDPSTGVAGLVHPHSHAYGAAGTSGSKNGSAGTALTVTTSDLLLVGAGGGGGYQSSSGAAGNGGAGIGYGGPGGGGGASLNGNSAGAGGAGAGGVLRIIWVA